MNINHLVCAEFTLLRKSALLIPLFLSQSIHPPSASTPVPEGFFFFFCGQDVAATDYTLAVCTCDGLSPGSCSDHKTDRQTDRHTQNRISCPKHHGVVIGYGRHP